MRGNMEHCDGDLGVAGKGPRKRDFLSTRTLLLNLVPPEELEGPLPANVGIVGILADGRGYSLNRRNRDFSSSLVAHTVPHEP